MKLPIMIHNTLRYWGTNIVFNYTSRYVIALAEKAILIDSASLLSVIIDGKDNWVR